MKLIICLGNIGKKYTNTRHNVGFEIANQFASKHELKFKKRIKYEFIEYHNCLIVKPKTYMNLSGDALTSIRTSFNIDEFIVLVDDINLPLGSVRIRKSGSAGGHNGLKSIQTSKGSNDYPRIRVGVDNPGSNDLKDYVLSKFSSDELKIVAKISLDVLDLLEMYIDNDYQTMVDFSSRNKLTYSDTQKSGSISPQEDN
ncbi:MAG: aminoacyl-tRNA hydrolase [Candidatus Zophobacter franzmannii]|jgi:PTH1 family peptidyl-tRNA hydrolase|nr:aminoacyl-tRNA hydrolase [Candidatus Zophobacter franzmannii]